MIKEYKQILDKKRIELRSKIRELKSIQENNENLRTDYNIKKRRYENFELPKEPNFFEKLTKNKYYSYYQKKLQEHEELRKEMEEAEKALENLQPDDDLEKEIDELDDRIEEYDSIDYSKAISYFLENNKQIILTIEDIQEFKKEYTEEYGERYNYKKDKGRKIEKLEDIMLVHKTDYIPQNSEIGSRMTSDVINEHEHYENGKIYSIKYRPYRNTVHFSVNHEVMGHGNGDWSKKKYIIIVPLKSIPKEKIKNNNEVDTYTEGSVKLTEECYIICPKEDIEKVKKENPNCTIIGYEGEPQPHFANTTLWFLGYPVEDANEHGFNNNEETKRYMSVIENSGYYKSYEKHYYSKEKEDENNKLEYSIFIGMLELIINGQEFQNLSPEEIEKITRLSEKLPVIGEYYKYNAKDIIYINSYLKDIGLDPIIPLEGIKSYEQAKKYALELIKKAQELNKQEVKKSR